MDDYRFNHMKKVNEFCLDFIGIGFSRAGTTWVAKILSNHPGIYLPPKKELHFFNDNHRYSKGLTELQKHFPPDIKKIKGEFTPRYIIYRTALLRIKKHFPSIKLIVCMRNPVDRAFSQYKFFRMNKQKESNASFERALTGPYKIDYVDKSLYSKHLKQAFKIFGKKNIHIILYDDIEKHPEKVSKNLYAFLGVSTTHTPTFLAEKINASQSTSKPPSRLLSFYQSTVNNIASYIPDSILRLLRPMFTGPLLILNKIIRRLNKATSIMRKSEQHALDDETRRRVYCTYFKDDVENLEKILGTSFHHWKTPCP